MLTIDNFIETIDHLPPAPRNLAKLVELLKETDVDVAHVVDLIQYDPALTAQIMRLCNSAYFGGGAPADNLHEAIARLGFTQIFQLVTALSTATLIRPKQAGYGIETGELWRHCVTAAFIGKFLAVERGENASLIFTAGLLHDIGKVVLSRSLEDQYNEVIAETKREQAPMLAVERKLLGFDHAEAGGRLLERWKFPQELVEAVRFHHDPARAPEFPRTAAYTYVANMIACFMGFGCGHEALALRGRTEALDLLNVPAEEIPRQMARAFDALRETDALLNFAF